MRYLKILIYITIIVFIETLLSCENTEIHGWQTVIVYSQGFVGEFTSIALNSNNKPYISYYDETNRYLKMAWYE